MTQELTLQQLADRFGSKTDAGMLEYIQTLLQWRTQVPQETAADLLQKMTSVLKKNGETVAMEETRSGLMDAISQLNIRRAALRTENEQHTANLKIRQDWLAEFDRVKAELARLNANAAKAEEQKTALEKEITETQRKYAETKKMIDSVRQNVWLKADAKEKIGKVWETLPADALDNALSPR